MSPQKLAILHEVPPPLPLHSVDASAQRGLFYWYLQYLGVRTPHFLFSGGRKENGPFTVQKKRALVKLGGGRELGETNARRPIRLASASNTAAAKLVGGGAGSPNGCVCLRCRCCGALWGLVLRLRLTAAAVFCGSVGPDPASRVPALGRPFRQYLLS